MRYVPKERVVQRQQSESEETVMQFNIKDHPLLRATDYVTMDYVLAALDGANSNNYVNGSYDCGLNGRGFAVDVRRTITSYLTTDMSTQTGKETVFFNTTATISGYLPGTIYFCYFVPGRAYKTWNEHFK